MIDTQPMSVAPSNRDQAAAWDGQEGEYWAESPQRFDDSIAAHHRRLIASLDITDSSRALDIGCGTGQTTRDVARLAPAGNALGIDLSSQMLDVARRAANAEGLTNVSFVQGDAQVHPFDEASADIVLSRTGAMFFADKPAAFTNLARALRPAGQLALIVWREAERNEWITEFRTALAAGRDLPMPPTEGPSPFSMIDPTVVRALLEGTGFRDVTFDSVDEPMLFGSDAADAQEFVLGLLGWMLSALDETGQARARDALRQTMESHTTDAGVLFASSAWLITARRA